MKKKIDLSQFMLNDEDLKQMRHLDKKTMKTDPNYQQNKRVNLEYYNESDLEDIGVDDILIVTVVRNLKPLATLEWIYIKYPFFLSP